MTESQHQNLALTVLYVRYSLNSSPQPCLLVGIFRPKIDGCVPQTQHGNLKTVGQPEGGRGRRPSVGTKNMVEVHSLPQQEPTHHFFFFFCTLVTGPRRSLSLKLSDSRVCKSHLRARLPITRGAAPARKMVMGVLPVPPHVTFPTLRQHARVLSAPLWPVVN